jgi:hypothetical protein
VGARTSSGAFWTHLLSLGAWMLWAEEAATLRRWEWPVVPAAWQSSGGQSARSGRRSLIWSGRGGGKCKRHVPECRPREGSIVDQVNGGRLDLSLGWTDNPINTNKVGHRATVEARDPRVGGNRALRR